MKQSLAITKRGTLKQIVLTRPENFIDAVEKLTAIKSITVEQVSYDFREKNFQPIAKAADRIVERAVFWRPSKQQAVKDAVMGFLRERIGGVKNAKLVGVDPSEQEVTLKLLHDYDVFQEYDYDDFIKNVSLDMDDFATTINESSNIESLISIAKKTPIKELLEVPPKRPPAKKKK